MGVFAFGGVGWGNPGRPDRAPSPGGAGCRRTVPCVRSGHGAGRVHKLLSKNAAVYTA